jgi:glycosyl-4,4'-diaponeurosporenoate acyltransferase
MWLDLSNLWIVILNVIGIPGIHLGISWIFTRLSSERFSPQSPLFRHRASEKNGTVYHRVFRIRNWKGFIPDAAPWFDGFAKGSLGKKYPEYLRNFIRETCRGEAAHYAQIPGILLTLIWNPWPVAAIVMIVYAFLSNLPCILLQRFTRARMRHLLSQIEEGE